MSTAKRSNADPMLFLCEGCDKPKLASELRTVAGKALCETCWHERAGG